MMNRKVTINAFVGRAQAKVNLSLAIMGKRNGLHIVDMILAQCSLFEDVAVFEPANTKSVKIQYHGYVGFDGARFDAYFAPRINRLAKRLGISGRLTLTKGVPLGAGLGGSSSCIAAAKRAMDAYLKSIGKFAALDNLFLCNLSSDLPAMLTDGVRRVTGVGENVIQLDEAAPDFDVFIAEGSCDTAACYAKYDELGKFDTSAPPESVKEALEARRNDLTAAACALEPNIAIAMEELEGKYRGLIMSGSGSAIVCLK